jgi:3-deoxy-D-manno-octulosonate 8-phosphate phosphatase (KDO 8-P phosphatase)
VRHLFQGVEDKLATFHRLRGRLGMSSSVCACVGDDLPDVPLMREVGLSFAVADAHPQARGAAHVTTLAAGGMGAVREVCDYLLEARRHAAAIK